MKSRDLLPPRRLAEILGVSPVTILEWYHAGKIPAEIAEGRIYRFDEQKVRTALAQRATKKVAKVSVDPSG